MLSATRLGGSIFESLKSGPRSVGELAEGCR